MRKEVFAKIEWAHKESENRKTTNQTNLIYAPIVVINNFDNKGIWSSRIKILDVSDNCSKIILSYLSPDAPQYLLEKGNTFNLFEGDRLVATGVIL